MDGWSYPDGHSHQDSFIHPSIRPLSADFLGLGSGGSNIFQILLRDPEAFPGQMKYNICWDFLCLPRGLPTAGRACKSQVEGAQEAPWLYPWTTKKLV